MWSRTTADVPVDGRRSRWAAHRVARRDELIDAAVALDQAARRRASAWTRSRPTPRTSKPVIYRYFADKTDLYRAVTQRVVGTILAALRAVTERAPGAAASSSAPASTPTWRCSSRARSCTASSSGTRISTAAARPFSDGHRRHARRPARDVTCAPAASIPRSRTRGAKAIVGFISAASLLVARPPVARCRARSSRDYLAALLWGGAAGVQQLRGAARRRPSRPGRLPAPATRRDRRDATADAPPTTVAVRRRHPAPGPGRPLGTTSATRPASSPRDPRFAVTVGEDIETQRARRARASCARWPRPQLLAAAASRPQYGGQRRRRRLGHRRSRCSRSATCRCWSRPACSGACSAARSCTSAPNGTTTRYLADDRQRSSCSAASR